MKEQLDKTVNQTNINYKSSKVKNRTHNTISSHKAFTRHEVDDCVYLDMIYPRQQIIIALLILDGIGRWQPRSSSHSRWASPSHRCRAAFSSCFAQRARSIHQGWWSASRRPPVACPRVIAFSRSLAVFIFPTRTNIWASLPPGVVRSPSDIMALGYTQFMQYSGRSIRSSSTWTGPSYTWRTPSYRGRRYGAKGGNWAAGKGGRPHGERGVGGSVGGRTRFVAARAWAGDVGAAKSSGRDRRKKVSTLTSSLEN